MTKWSPAFRGFMAWLACSFGALAGWALVELGWRNIHRGIHIVGKPERGWQYLVLALLCSLALGIAAMALVRWRDLPTDPGGPNESASS